MSRSRFRPPLALAASAATLLAAGCGNKVATAPENVATVAQTVQKLSQVRLNAARQLSNALPVRVDILQLQNGGAMINDPCDPLGLDFAHHDAWVSTINNPDPFLPDWNFEYDWISSKGSQNLSGGTDYIVSIRAGRSEPPDAESDLRFTQVEIIIRAVNPRSNGHVQGDNYLANQADFPSNADPPEIANRSLFDLTGEDVAIVVYGLTFRTQPGKAIIDTLAFEHALGPNAWLFFLRDNAFQSGRFYAIEGALKGGPRAGETTYFSSPPLPPGEALPQPPLGLFQSVQLNGTQFDLLAEPFSSAVDDPGYVCPVDLVSGDGSPTPGKRYAFLDRSNRDENGLLTPAGVGRGGYIFVIRKAAFQGKQVVSNPNADPPAPPDPADLIGPFNSGYNEFPIPVPVINLPPARHDNAPGGVPNGVPGVHEIGISVLFVHMTEPTAG
jgi:hypothetical protein